MVDILRDPTRQYTPDLQSAIRRQNTAAAINDAKQVVGIGATAVAGYGALRGYLSAEDVEKANLAIEAANKIISGERQKILDAGRVPTTKELTDITNSAYDSATRDWAKDIKWREATDSLKKAREDALTNLNLDNIDIEYKLDRQKRLAEQKEAADLSKVAQAVQSANYNLGTAAVQAGQMGNIASLGEAFPSFEAAYDKATEGRGLPATNLAQKTDAKISAVQLAFETALASDDMNIKRAADAVFSSKENFESVLPSGFIDSVAEKNKNALLEAHNRELNILRMERATTLDNTANAKDLDTLIERKEKQIEALLEDGEILAFAENGDETSVPLNDYTSEGLRNTIAKKARQVATKELGMRALAAREEAYQIEKEKWANGLDDPYSVELGILLQKNAQAEKDGRSNLSLLQLALPSPAVLMKPGALSMYGILFEAARGSESARAVVAGAAKDIVSGEAPKVSWQKMYDDYKEYQNDKVTVSQLQTSSFDTQHEAAIKVINLMEKARTNDVGDPTEWQAAQLSVLSEVMKMPLTEKQRSMINEYVIEAGLLGDAEYQERLKMLRGGDVAIYRKGGLPGVGTVIPNSPIAPLGEVAIKVVPGMLRDAREFGVLSPVTEFQNRMRDAQAEYSMRAIQMSRDGVVENGQSRPATANDAMMVKKQIFDQAINDFYRDYYVIDLVALDEKLKNKEKAYANLDGVIYEYYSRDAIGAPLWLDRRPLNMNRDFTRLTQSYRIGVKPEESDE